jgi:acyl dehydratase
MPNAKRITDGSGRIWYYEDFEVGQEFETQYELTHERVADFIRILGYESPMVTQGHQGRDPGDVPVPPAIAASYHNIAAVPGMTLPAGGIYLKQEFKFGAKSFIGDTMITVTRVESKYERKGRKYIRFESQTVNQHGEQVVWGLRTRIW